MRHFEANPPTFETERLVLKPVTLEDSPTIQRYFERWEVVEHLNKSVPWPYPPDGALVYLRDVLLPATQAGREQAWALFLKTQPGLIGVVLLCTEGDENRGFWLAPEHWGLGLMTEATDRLLDHVFFDLEWPDLVTANATQNVGSRRVKEKQGFEKIADFSKEFVGGRKPCERYRVTRENWLNREHRANLPKCQVNDETSR